MKGNVTDMTEGSPVRLLLTFSLPMLVGNLFQQLYTMIDSIIVGNYIGANALAAVGATSSVQFLLFSLSSGMSAGIGIVVSQYLGAKDEEYVKRSIANSIYVMLAAAVFMSLLGFFLSRPMLKLLNTPDNIIDSSDLFLKTICVGLVAVAAYNGISAILRSLGDSTTPLVFLTVSILVNIVLDFLFVLDFKWGVFGTAIATLIAQAIAALGSLLFAVYKNPYFKISKHYLAPNKEIIIRCARLGIPVALQGSMISVSLIVLQSVVNSFGSVVVAAFTVTSRIEQLVQQPYNSLGSAVSTYTGQNIGAGDIERVRTGYRKSFLIMGIFTLCMLPLAQFFGEPIMRLFVNDAEVIVLGTQALKITSWFYFPLGMIYITRGLLNGAGDTVYSFINGIIEMAGRIGFSGPLTKIGPIGVWGVWLATALTWLITGVASFIRYKQGNWKNKCVVRKEYRKSES
jgi:putative efflux protein, MATE family